MAWCTVKLETVTLVFAVINLLGSIFGCGVIVCVLFVFPNDLAWKNCLSLKMIMQEQRTKCLSAKMGALIFAVANVIFTGFWCLLSVSVVFYSVLSVFSLVNGENGRDQYVFANAFRDIGMSVLSMLPSSVSFIFAVFLIHGVVKKRPEHMHAYFVFGVVLLSLLFLGGLLTAYRDFIERDHNFYRAENLMPIAIVILLIFIYTLILSMIRKTYRQMEAFNLQYGPKLLIESEKC